MGSANPYPDESGGKSKRRQGSGGCSIYEEKNSILREESVSIRTLIIRRAEIHEKLL